MSISDEKVYKRY